MLRSPVRLHALLIALHCFTFRPAKPWHIRLYNCWLLSCQARQPVKSSQSRKSFAWFMQRFLYKNLCCKSTLNEEGEQAVNCFSTWRVEERFAQNWNYLLIRLAQNFFPFYSKLDEKIPFKIFCPNFLCWCRKGKWKSTSTLLTSSWR